MCRWRAAGEQTISSRKKIIMHVSSLMNRKGSCICFLHNYFLILFFACLYRYTLTLCWFQRCDAEDKDRFGCSQWMDGVWSTDPWSASHVEAELSAGEVLRTAFDEQIKRGAGTLAFSLPRSSLWIGRGLFRLLLFVCLFLFFGKQTSSSRAFSVWWGNERTERVRWREKSIIPSNISATVCFCLSVFYHCLAA